MLKANNQIDKIIVYDLLGKGKLKKYCVSRYFFDPDPKNSSFVLYISSVLPKQIHSMKNNSKLAKRLTQYSSFALAIMGISETNGQVIYTDVNPDFSGSMGSVYALDLDNNDIVDFALLNSNISGSFYLYASPSPYYSNGILGSIGSFYKYPFALDAGVNISSGASGNFLVGYSNILNYNGQDGNWIGVTDKYLGVRFDIAGNTHYGWIRLDVDANANYVVKDFAYEATPNKGIKAGAGQLSVKSNDFESFSFYPNPVKDKLMLEAKSPITAIAIYDLLGKEVISKTPGQTDYQMNASQLPPGTYFMKITINGKNNLFKLIKE